MIPRRRPRPPPYRHLPHRSGCPRTVSTGNARQTPFLLAATIPRGAVGDHGSGRAEQRPVAGRPLRHSSSPSGVAQFGGVRADDRTSLGGGDQAHRRRRRSRSVRRDAGRGPRSPHRRRPAALAAGCPSRRARRASPTASGRGRRATRRPDTVGPASLKIVASPSAPLTMATVRRVSPLIGVSSAVSPASNSSSATSSPVTPPTNPSASTWCPSVAATRATLTPLPPARCRMSVDAVAAADHEFVDPYVTSSARLRVTVPISPATSRPASPSGRRTPRPARTRSARLPVSIPPTSYQPNACAGVVDAIRDASTSETPALHRVAVRNVHRQRAAGDRMGAVGKRRQPVLHVDLETAEHVPPVRHPGRHHRVGDQRDPVDTRPRRARPGPPAGPDACRR